MLTAVLRSITSRCVCGHYVDKVVRFYYMYCRNGNAMFSDIRFLSGAFGSHKKGCFGS